SIYLDFLAWRNRHLLISSSSSHYYSDTLFMSKAREPLPPITLLSVVPYPRGGGTDVMWSWRFQGEGLRLSRLILSTLLMLGFLMSLSGCTRRFFRRGAGAQVDEIVCEKDRYPQWKINDYYVYPHPLSRFADPTDPDRPPMPPDDPAAWDLSPHPQRPLLKGYKYWQGTGYLELMRRWDMENRAKQDEQRAQQEEESEGEEAKLMGELKTSAERAREIEQNIEAELAAPISGNQQRPVTLEVSGLSTNKPFLLNLEQI